ncbi:MAG: polysaccharide biosynthesis/export family protein [Syntrophales bacterium]|jgi:protein involved in polysaccharide export with SLBB domain|nr:polysaccharide biosynthesis/export family protein [Syntrophales bacterium]MDY0044511.1 polysaccharide biosynthesis/export family protein [Syntrophales bacterium]
MTKKFLLLVLLCIAVAIQIISCGPVVKNPTSLNIPEVRQAGLGEEEYRIQVGDRLDVKFFYDPELNETVVVRPDGKISLQLVHEIDVAGKTTPELASILNKRYAKHLKQPEIAVIVRTFDSYKVFVDGEVKSPGVHTFTGYISAMQSIASAGGFKDTARLNEILVIRKAGAEKPIVIPLDLKKVIDGTDLKQDITLLPLDIVYVPKSPVANVNTWIDQYIRKNIPVPFGFGFTVDLNNNNN